MSNLSHERTADSLENAIRLIQEKVYREGVKNRNMARRRPGFEPGEAGAEAAKLNKFSDAGGSQRQWLSDTARTDPSITSGIKARGDLPSASVARQLEILDQLAQFDLGRFLIQHRCGLNGYWTHYLVLPPSKGTTEMEEFILKRMPLVKAMQERFQFFQKTLQKELKEGGSYASIPSGVMGDLLLLDYSKLQEFSLTAVDLDPESLQLAENLAKEKGLSSHFRSEMKNAWEWKEKEQYDVIVSNGLNFYEPNNEKVIQLYQIFYRSLKPGGLLVTSYLTPPPHKVHRCEWKMEQLSFEDLFIQKIIVADLLDAKWQAFRSTEETKTQLQKAGFSEIEFQPDSAGLFPTVLARVKL